MINKILKKAALIIIVLSLTYTISARADSTGSIDNPDQANEVLEQATSMLNNKLGMTFKYPIKIVMVTGPELDQLIPDSPYRGNVTGLHCFENGVHNVYMMKNTGRDDFFGTLCHELTHGWQDENCPGQETRLKEGLAVWVQYKCLKWDGAYVKAANLNQWIADPVYGVGYRFIQKLEDQYGEHGVLKAVKNYTQIP